MKPLLASLWQRRWCRVLGIVLIACALAMLHPFVRQTLIGPKIDDIPWCVWEDQIRREAEPQRPKSWFYEALEKIGLISRDRQRFDLDAPTALPVYLHLAEDGDRHVRHFALERLSRWSWVHRESEALPMLRRHLHDDDPLCRAVAAVGVWTKTQDVELRHIFIPLVDHNDPKVQRAAVEGLWRMADRVPETFEPLAKVCESSDLMSKTDALHRMHRFGKRSFPILRKALSDPHPDVRRSAIYPLARMGKKAAEFESALLALRSDSNPNIREAAAEALSSIDPARYPLRAKKEEKED